MFLSYVFAAEVFNNQPITKLTTTQEQHLFYDKLHELGKKVYLDAAL